MKIAALAVMAVVLGQAATQAPQDTTTPKPVTFNDPQLGLLFDHPATWVVKKNAKGHGASKAEKGITVLNLPTSTSPTGGTLEIFHAKFSSTPEIWQTVQLRSNEQLHRKVDRQWQQDILGVPLLLTRISYTDGSSSVSTLTGLLYTRTHDKLLFRLSGPTSDFDNLQYAFTTSMQSLRTADGAMPVEEDPDHPLPAAKKGDVSGTAKVALFSHMPTPKPVIAPSVEKLVVSTKPINFRYSDDWTVSQRSGNTITLKSEDVTAPVTLTFYSSLDSDPASNVLLQLSAQDLNLFDTVTMRLDHDPKPNRGGCTICSVWRIGKAKGSPLYSYQAYGQQGDYYFIANFHGSSATESIDDQKAIDDLLRTVSLQIQP